MVFDTMESDPPCTGFDYDKIRGYQLELEYLKDNDTVVEGRTTEKNFSVAGIKLELKHRYLYVDKQKILHIHSLKYENMIHNI